MEALLGLIGLGLVLLLLAASVVALVALVRVSRLAMELGAARETMRDLEARLEALARPGAAPGAEETGAPPNARRGRALNAPFGLSY